MSTTIGSTATPDPTTSTTGTTPTDYSQVNKDKTGSAMGLDKDAFLKILVEQLKDQDPTSPSDSSQYVQQMTSYSMLEQLTNISSAMQVQQTNSAGQTAVGLMGHTVTYVDDDGNQQSGEVTGISFANSDGPTLTVGGKAGISLGSVVQVGATPAPAPASAPTGGTGTT
jgi:flagellar basal-body rod modification protein FlgD